MTVYPRPHGEAASGGGDRIYGRGLSPPTRGSHEAPPAQPTGEGSIPAHTGKPMMVPPTTWRITVYPRPHGEAMKRLACVSVGGGLSPPTRGSRVNAECASRLHGSIPAHTGKPAQVTAQVSMAAVYPRPHGEAVRASDEARFNRGLSPPTRGSLGIVRVARAAPGSIPAHTGKPVEADGTRHVGRVYPRPHGEAPGPPSPTRRSCGLSPPTRGSRPGAPGSLPRQRSIPAHTGKPWPISPARRPARVYPRPHGEARRGRGGYLVTWGLPPPPGGSRGGGELPSTGRGLSPPTRGSRPGQADACARYGSIPAHTGKPRLYDLRGNFDRVYPRPHGEALAKATWKRHSKGLSPPTRGSPRRCARRLADAAVYPRPHGEAGCRGQGQAGSGGLSPPTRGSLERRAFARRCNRSIPAHTGKPRPRRPPDLPSRVYPRPHGEASLALSSAASAQGLSPPTRGSRDAGGHAVVGPGSIPAHTGKPPRPPRSAASRGVYPRPHGEAAVSPGSRPPQPGLSPPTRGSLMAGPGGRCTARSIPAHTGKPP